MSLDRLSKFRIYFTDVSYVLFGESRVVDLRHVKEPQAEIRASKQNLSDFSRSMSEATLMISDVKSVVKPNNNNFLVMRHT